MSGEGRKRKLGNDRFRLPTFVFLVLRQQYGELPFEQCQLASTVQINEGALPRQILVPPNDQFIRDQRYRIPTQPQIAIFISYTTHQ